VPGAVDLEVGDLPFDPHHRELVFEQPSQLLRQLRYGEDRALTHAACPLS